MRQIQTANFIRANKRSARALYRTGQQNRLFLCPVNLNPEHWGLYCNCGGYDTGAGFDTLVNSFEYYNCINNETGRYTAFYVPREWYELRQAAARDFNPESTAAKLLAEWEEVHA